MIATTVLFASTLGRIFQPVFEVMAKIIAAAYSVVPNYTVAIAFLTVVVMLVTAPLTVKSTRSMTAMQKLAPELKKIQQKYKGDRQRLNEEMMALYKAHGVNPAGGCLPMLLQFPVFIVLYDVIRGLTNTIKSGAYFPPDFHVSELGHSVKYATTQKGIECLQAVCSAPRYIGHNTKLFQGLITSNGTMPSFGIHLADRVLGHHSIVSALPYALLIVIAIGLQYLQMRLLNNRNPAAAQANPQAMMMQRYMPLIFAVIYINIPAAVNIYFIVSNLSRIGLQSYAFHTGKPSAPGEVTIPGRGASAGGRPAKRSMMERLADAQQKALEAQQARQKALESGPEMGPDDPDHRQPTGETPEAPGSTNQASNGSGGNRPRPRPNPKGSAGNGSGAPKPTPNPNRSKAKRSRKAR